MIDALSQFRDAIRAVGMEPPAVIEPGKWHRFPGIGKSRSNRAGWCMLFADGLGGRFGDWSSGLSETWQARRGTVHSRAERAAFARRLEAARAQSDAARRAREARAADRAIRIWKGATPAPVHHPYLTRKRIELHGARLYKGALTLPVISFEDRLTSLQFIARDGRKRLLTGGRKWGCFIPVLPAQNSHNTQNSIGTGISADCAEIAYRDLKSTGLTPVVICEGWATGCTLVEDDPSTLVLAARSRWPAAELVIAGDDDRRTSGNPGARNARAATIAADALLALPQWPQDAPDTLTDFNDLAGWLAGGGA